MENTPPSVKIPNTSCLEKTCNQNVPIGKTKKLLKLLRCLCTPTKYHADRQHEDSLMKPLKSFDYCFTVLGNLLQMLFLKFLFSLVLAPLNIPTEVLTQVIAQMQFTNKGTVLFNGTKTDLSFM